MPSNFTQKLNDMYLQSFINKDTVENHVDCQSEKTIKAWEPNALINRPKRTGGPSAVLDRHLFAMFNRCELDKKKLFESIQYKLFRVNHPGI